MPNSHSPSHYSLNIPFFHVDVIQPFQQPIHLMYTWCCIAHHWLDFGSKCLHFKRAIQVGQAALIWTGHRYCILHKQCIDHCFLFQRQINIHITEVKTLFQEITKGIGY